MRDEDVGRSRFAIYCLRYPLSQFHGNAASPLKVISTHNSRDFLFCFCSATPFSSRGRTRKGFYGSAVACGPMLTLDEKSTNFRLPCLLGKNFINKLVDHKLADRKIIYNQNFSESKNFRFRWNSFRAW